MLMESAELQAKVKALYRAAVAAGLVETYKEFAKLTDVSRNTISRMINGDTRYINERLYYRMEGALREHGVTINGEANTNNYGDSITVQSEDNHGSVIGKQVGAGDARTMAALINEIKEQRMMFAEQLRIKDEQIAMQIQMCQALLYSAHSGNQRDV